MTRRKVAIIGVGQTQYRSQHEATLPELAQQAALAALEDADMTMEDIEAVVFSMGPSEFVGMNDPEKWCVGAVGGRNRPFMRINTGGATGTSAIHAGFYHIASGIFDSVLVVGADKVRECKDSQQVLNTIWDPLYERQFALTTITMAAFQAVRHIHLYGTTEEQMALIAVRSWKNALNNPVAHLKGRITVEDVMKSPYLCWPIKKYEICPSSAGGAAVVMVSEKKARRMGCRPAWIKGCSEFANTVFQGDQMGGRAEMDFADSDILAMAAKEAFHQAGIANPLKDIQVAELYAPFTICEISMVEALGFCGKGEGGRLNERGFFDIGGRIAVNPSGGTLCANAIAVTGLARVCDGALQVMEKATPGMQVEGVRNVVCHGEGGSFQFHAVVVLGAE
ncbi:MAG: thiolase family protein [Deltaproteobacteria bacterium]|nr:thiolase family protein [Deltaproteobacteria bacterium]